MNKSARHHRNNNARDGRNSAGSGKPQTYASNARFIEIGSPGVPFRSLVNIDHIVNVRFEQATMQPEEGPPVLIDGWVVTVSLINQANTLNFPDLDSAINMYNELLDQIAVMAPCTVQARLEIPEAPYAEPEDEVPAANEDPGNLELTDEEKYQLENPEIDDGEEETPVDEKPVYPH